MLDGLKLLDSMSWQSIDELKVLDTRAIRRSNPPIYLTVDPQPKPRKLHVSLTHDKKLDPLQAALFNGAARLVSLTVVNQLSNRFGFYAGELHGAPAPLSVTGELLVFPRLWQHVNIDEVAELSWRVMKKMLTPAVIERIACDVGAVNYLNSSRLSPDFERILNQTQVIVAQKAGKRLLPLKKLKQCLREQS